MAIYMHNRPPIPGLLDRYRVGREVMRDTQFKKRTGAAYPSSLMTKWGARARGNTAGEKKNQKTPPPEKRGRGKNCK